MIKILNGRVANTLYYLINEDKIEEVTKVNKLSYLDFALSDISCYYSSPNDIQDFTLCYNAYVVFQWTGKDIELAIKNLKRKDADVDRNIFEPENKYKVLCFLENFFILLELYKNDDFIPLYKKIKYIRDEVTKDNNVLKV